MALTRTDTVRLALSQLGVEESPPYSNRQKFGVWMGFNGVPWCAIFQSWVLAHAGNTSGYRFASTAASVSWARRRSRLIPPDQARPGDVFVHLYTSSLGHTGMATERPANNEPVTVEGNTSMEDDRDGGSVMLRRRSLDYWHYCIRLDYPDAPPLPPVTKPSWEDDVPKPTDFTSACVDPVTGGIFRQTAEGGVDGLNGARIGKTYKDFPAAGGNIRYFTAIVPNGSGGYIQIGNDGAQYNSKDWG